MGFEQPIIAPTADTMHDDMDGCLECVCNAYLSKAIDANELLKIVTQHTSEIKFSDY